MIRRSALAALGAVCLGKFALFLYFAMVPTAHVHAQQTVFVAQDCLLTFNLKASGAVSNPLTNTGTACQFWSLTYEANGFSGVTLQLNAAADNNNSPGSFSIFPGTSAATSTNTGSLTATGFQPWLQVALTSATGSGSVKGVLQGWRNSASGNPSVTITSIPAIPYNANPFTLTNGQTQADVQIVNNGGVRMVGAATTDGIVALSSASTSTLAGTVWAIDANPGNLYGFNIGQSGTSACFLQLFNVAAGSVTLGVTAPTQIFLIPGQAGGAGNSISPGDVPLRNYSTAISGALTTGGANGTPCGNVGAGTVFFK